MDMAMEKKGPLTKIRVIEIANVLAGPFCGNLLADYGADVIKVEMPGVGDPFREMLPKINGESVRWPTIARNKRCITLDLKAPEGKKILLELVKEADMVIENFRPGTLDKWGIPFAEMKKVNPKVVLCHISGYGQTGPYAPKAGFGTALTAFSGFTAITGYADRPPYSPSLAIADFLGGIFACLGGLSAVLAIKTGVTDEGQEIDATLYEPLLRLQEGHVTEYGLDGTVHVRAPMDNSVACPVAALKCKDGKFVVLVASTQKTWERCAELVGGTEFRDDSRFATNPLRMEHVEEVMAPIEAFVAARDSKEVCDLFEGVGVPCCPIIEVDDMVKNEQYIARESIVKAVHPRFGEISMPGIFPKFSGTPCEVSWVGPDMGSFNEEIFKGMLGYTDEQFAKLKEKKII